jgi:20S proteasome alpha/beta subunit
MVSAAYLQRAPVLSDSAMGNTDQPVSMGTSIVAVTYAGGVILGADSRTSTGSYVANRTADKARAGKSMH